MDERIPKSKFDAAYVKIMAEDQTSLVGDFDPEASAAVRTSEPAHAPCNDDAELASARQKRLLMLFQHTATSLTHLYKCKSKCQNEDQESWLAFQSAASALTSLYRESTDILASKEKPSSRVACTVTSATSVGPALLSDCSSRNMTKNDTINKSSANDFMSEVLGASNGTSMSTTSPSTNSFDFLNSSRFKRSWSDWPDDDNMDHFGAKRRKFL